MAKNLVIYYSRRGQNWVNGGIGYLDKGNGEYIAEYIQKAVGADLFQIDTVKAYSKDYTTCTEEAEAELKSHARLELKEYLKDISGYKNIFVVGPCWWGTYPMPMFTQLERLDFSGKKVLPVMTHEGSGMGSGERDLKKICAGASFGKGLAVQGTSASKSEAKVAEWAKSQIG